MWRLVEKTPDELGVPADGEPVGPTWAWGGSTGRGVRVCIVDSGVEAGHPRVGPVTAAWAVTRDSEGAFSVDECEPVDVCGHGTACASIVRRVAPECELFSLRVLGARGSGSGDMLLAGLRWAVRQGFDVLNLSLSTTKVGFRDELRAVTDEAYFGRTVIVASAHNLPVESFPWRFASVISVGSHREDDPELYLYNPDPPVEFFAPGQNVEVGWLGGKTIRSTGNSFATPFIAGLAARILAKHPRLTPFQLKNALYLSAANVTIPAGGDS